ncbi:hypothetical protein H1R20_g10218, partial [Candolleomyces eurysporus]
MSGLSAWIWGTSQLDDAIDRATSELLPSGSEDIALNLEICDQIRSKSAPARDAMRAIKRRLNHKNPNVQLLALGLSDICVKNGGDLFLVEIASREFMDNLVSILKMPTLNQEVKNMILRVIQNWGVAFEGKQNLSYVGQVYETLKKEGFKFPPKDMAVANSAMIDTQTAPEWVDSDLCLRCRTPFTFTNRKHHCRNCGQVFDQACSSKSMPLPHYGITQEVRVCDGCYNKLTKKANTVSASKKDHQHQHQHQHRKHHHSHRTAAQDLEDAELQRAIELSLEASRSPTGGYTSLQPEPERWQASEPPLVDRRTRPVEAQMEDDDPDLKAAIEASLREANAPRPSAPMAEPTSGYSDYQPSSTVNATLPPPSVIPHYDLDPLETDTILTFNQTVEQVEASGGRDLSRYPAVTELYDKASGLRPKLAMSLDDTGKKQEVLSDMHSKLSEAVKLYDQILTHQVSQPRWRSAVASPTTAPTYQPAMNAYHTGYNPQWQQQQPAYPAEQQYATPSSPPQQQSQWVQQQPQQQYAPAPSAPQLSPTVPQQVPSQFAPTSSSYMQQQPVNGNTTTLPPVTFGHPVSVPQSPPPPPPLQQAMSPPPQVGLGRSNTVSASTSSYAAPPSQVNLARSGTVGSGYQPQRQYTQPQQQQHAPYQQQHQQQYHQQQYQQDQYRQSLIANAPAPPTSVLNLPSAPTEAPAPYVVKEERKEALLIDL